MIPSASSLEATAVDAVQYNDFKSEQLRFPLNRGKLSPQLHCGCSHPQREMETPPCSVDPFFSHAILAVTCWGCVSCSQPEHLRRGHGRFLRTHPHVSCPTVLPAGVERWEALSAVVQQSVTQKYVWYYCCRPPYGPLPAWATIKQVCPVMSHLSRSCIAGFIWLNSQSDYD